MGVREKPIRNGKPLPRKQAVTCSTIPGGIAHIPYLMVAQLLDHMAEAEQEIEKDVMLATLRTQVDGLAKRVMKIKSQCKKRINVPLLVKERVIGTTSLKCGRCKRGAKWRAADPIGESPKTPIISVISMFDSRHSLSLESVKLGELRKVLAIHLPDWRPLWLPPFEHPQLLRSFIVFGEVPNHSEVKALSPNMKELDKLQANAQNDS
uniref:Uncharacterized protein n=1 Tax=Solanum tuberosum TaxID=4113 RepID=M1DD50_SOLTU